MILLYMVKISLTPPGINIPAGQPRPDPVHIWATSIPVLLAGGAFVLLGLVMLVLILKDLGIQRLRRSRSFDLLALQSLLVLPLLTALPVVALGLYKHDNPLASQTIIASLVTFAILSSLAFVLGLLWNKKVWLRSAAMFWIIFILFYSTFFMHGEGFFKGIVGALAYWMSQQNVVRGTQPLYYYAFLQVPMYEYLPALGLLLAIGIGLRQRIFSTDPHRVFISAAKREPEPSGLDTTELTDSMDPERTESEHEVTVQQNLAEQPSDESSGSQTPDWLARWISPAPETQGSSLGLPILALCVYWSLMSLLAFTIAGERMPWLTTHITMPMILYNWLHSRVPDYPKQLAGLTSKKPGAGNRSRLYLHHCIHQPDCITNGQHAAASRERAAPASSHQPVSYGGFREPGQRFCSLALTAGLEGHPGA